MKIAVIGGGSTYTPELIHGFLQRTAVLPLTALWLMDNDPDRLEIVGRFAQRMVTAGGAPFSVHLTTDRQAAIANATYVITQLRVGGMAARREDEYLGQRHGLIGQETNGVGGLAKALRTIPVLLDIAADMRRLAPGALLVNFTNPAGLNMEALHRYAPDVASVGVCNGPITTKMHLVEMLSDLRGQTIAPERVQLDSLGLNHFGWYRGLTLDDTDLWPEILAQVERLPENLWNADLLHTLRLIPNSYLQYYYYTADCLARQAAWPPSRAEEVMVVEQELLRDYQNPNLATLPAGLLKRGGAYYSTLATQLLAAHHNDLGEIHILNVPNKGAVAAWPADWVLELPCRVDATGIQSLPAAPLPPECFGLLTTIKMYELLTVQAAVHGDHEALYKALLVNPLGPAADQIAAVVADLLAVNAAYLPAFAGAAATG
jgi:6-phospho-beta-glucosidase